MTWKNLIRDELRELSAYGAPRPDVAVKLDANESPFALPDEVAAEMGRLLAGVPIHRYPDAGAPALRALFARELGVAVEQLTLGNGSDEFITMIVCALGKPRRGESRARVAYPTPSFSMFRVGVIAGGAVPLEIPLKDDFTLDP
ncbi:MAG: aminotransferase class I/II-fold pyridoxal phosphate-dependent enzyme, partial [Myxococcota bacterium]